MITLNDIQNHMKGCIGYDSQGGWLSSKPINPVGNAGFLYIISDNVNDKFYIGSKVFYFKRHLMRSGKKKLVSYESDWKEYYGSSKKLTKTINDNDIDQFDRYHVSTWDTRRSLINEEANLLHHLDVLTTLKPDGSYLFWNESIGKSFRSDSHTQERVSKTTCSS